MNVNIFFTKNINNDHLIKFIVSTQKIKFILQNIRDLPLCKKQNNIIVFTEDTSIGFFQRKINEILNYKLIKSCFLLPVNLKKKSKKYNINIISYPIEILDFENNMFNLFNNKKYSFKDLELKYDNYLIQVKNNKQVRLTDVESKIIKLLFNTNKVSKQTLNSKVLNQLPSIESKSLESHLYRLRKKLLSIDNKTQILSTNNKSLKIN